MARNKKYPFDFATMAFLALSSCSEPMLSSIDIAEYIRNRFPGYETNDKQLMSNIRSMLEKRDCFLRINKSELPNQSRWVYWKIHPLALHLLGEDERTLVICLKEFSLDDYKDKEKSVDSHYQKTDERKKEPEIVQGSILAIFLFLTLTKIHS